jgi:3-deoxy-7-phosphoheptulonate synthase
MIIVMQPAASEEQIQHVVEEVEEAGLQAVLLRGERRNVIAAVGDRREAVSDRWLASPGVERVVPILSPYKLASREASVGATPVRLDGEVVGERKVQVIAGPCAVEDLDCTLDIAEAVKEAGAVGLRGGAYKPRTSPHTFQGLHEEGLKILHAVGKHTGLAVVTEVPDVAHVEVVAQYADVLQVGARNMQNFPLLTELGRLRKPVLLKRGISATVEELLLAAEYVLKGGNGQVMLCCRGIRTFEQQTRFTLSLGAVAHLKEATHLPVVVDPSHATGRRSLVGPMARAAVACGADGLLVEVHPDPEHALVDGQQTLTCEGFAELMAELRRVAEAVGREL